VVHSPLEERSLILVSTFRRYRTLTLLSAALTGMCLSASLALGQEAPKPVAAPAPAPAAAEPAAAAPNSGKISFAAGTDVVTQYFFRGLAQENQDLIVQPYASLTFKFYEGDGPVNNILVTVGTWNSLHQGPTGIDGSPAGSPEVWYESDFYTTVSTTLFDDWTASATYTAYMSPNSSYNTIQEIAVGLAYNDKELLGAFAVNPSILAAFEIDDQADAGNSLFALPNMSEGIYFQVGIKPGFTLIESKDYPVAVGFPIVVGLSLDDYYEDASGDDEAFGYVDAGIELSVPLAFIPSDYGAWTFTAGPHFIFLGENTQDYSTPNPNNGDDFAIWGKFSISMSY